MRSRILVPGFTAVLILIAILIACSGGNGSNTKGVANPATVTVTVSDPATCVSSTSTTGQFANVWVTITDVQIHASATAPDNDPNWVDLTPTLKNAPAQIDLLAAGNNQCFLATLGSTQALQPGSYQQMRIVLAANTNNLANNHCGAAGPNCVILAPPQTQVPQALLLSSESNTGIKIPSGQIAGGKFTVAAGDTKDLNIDFDTCASIVMQSNGQFRLKPVLHGGEVALTSVNASATITGRLFDKGTGVTIVGGKALVALELKDSTTGIDRVIMQTTPDNNGSFTFCPVPALATGTTYDVVAVAVNGSNVAYAATITTGVHPGDNLGNVPMTAVTGTTTTPGGITGQVTSLNGSNNGAAIDAMLSALQTVSSGTFTIPAGNPLSTTQPYSATLGVTTDKPAGCTTDPCPAYTVSYTMTLPPVAPTVGAFTTTPPGTNYVAGSGTPPATYAVEAQAFKPMSGGTTFCTAPTKTTANLSVNPGTPFTAAPSLDFTACQ